MPFIFREPEAPQVFWANNAIKGKKGFQPTGGDGGADLAQALQDWFDYGNAFEMKALSKDPSAKIGSQTINGDDLTPADQKRLTEETHLLQEAASSSRTGYTDIWRGAPLEEGQIPKPGSKVVLEGLTAASPVKSIALNYADPGNYYYGDGVPQRVLFRFISQNPKGVRGLASEPEPGFKEVVLPHGSTYRVGAVVRAEDGITYVGLMETP